jgi:AcrR family transcriptional regulator
MYGVASAPGPTSARDRILKAAKALFAEKGFEHAGTAAIARLAGSSESQLIKHFGGKRQLLAEIFAEGWRRIAERVRQAVAFAPNPAMRLGILGHTVTAEFERDPQLKRLLLLEGRRVRKGCNVALSEGFLDFIGLLDGILLEMRDAGQLAAGVHPQAVRSALMGAMESMMRDRYLAETAGYPANFAESELPQILSLIVRALAK